MPEPMPYNMPMQTGAYMMPQAGMGGILILVILAAMFLIVPIILFFVMMHKLHRRASDWQGIFSSDDVKKQMEMSNERVNSFVGKIDELFDLWIDREKRRKGR